MSNHQAQVAICIPSGRSWEADTAIRMIAAVSRATAQGIRTITMNEKNSVVSFSRNSMTENVINMGATHVMWVDSDNVPPVDIISRFLAADKDIIGGVYCKRVPPYELLGAPLADTDLTKGGVVPYWLLPGGCVMVKAEVYRAIPRPWYFDSIRRDGNPLSALMLLLEDHYRLSIPKEVREAIDVPVVNKWLDLEDDYNRKRYGGSINTGEDINFCMKAIRHGFEIWCDLDASYNIGHIGEQTIYPGRPSQKEENAGNI